MLKGIRLQAHPTVEQKTKLSQWMGCARYIWNAKTHEEKELRVKLNSIESKTYPKLDASYAHFKDKEETPWLFDCPSVLLRNSISNWYTTYQDFFKKRCGRPQHKKKDGRGSIYLTRELFDFTKGEDGVTRLHIGGKKHSIGYLSIKNHRSYKAPNSIYIRKKHQQYWVSFCYEDLTDPKDQLSEKQHLSKLRKKGEKYLQAHTLGIDRGVARPVQTSEDPNAHYDLNKEEKANKNLFTKQVRRFQKKLSRQKKGSNRRYKTKVRLSERHGSIAQIRENFCHQISRKLVDQEKTKVIIFENLGTARMTRKPKTKKGENGKYLKNNARAKAGLNRSILDKSWHLLEAFTTYKAKHIGKVVFKVAPQPYIPRMCPLPTHSPRQS